MRYRRSAAAAVLVLAAAGCSRAPTEQRAEPAAADEAAAIAGDAPAIMPGVAPGVAFDFRYAFALPEASIATAQEAHASQCGRLGLANCRVTGVDFSKDRNGAVRARTTFKISPAMALGFARDATALVESNGGDLAASTVGGTDAGSQIVAGDRSADGLRAELAKVEAQLRIPGLSRDVRGRLVEQARDFRAQLRALASDRDARVESLATTPVTFDYESMEAAGWQASIERGLDMGTASMSALLALLALALGAVGPWAVLAGAVWWLIRRMRRRPAVEQH